MAMSQAPAALETPWYRRVMRWGQTNVREIDAAPGHYDVQWWVDHWQRTHVQGVIINAGGIVAYYPSALPLHRRSPYLGERDLVGELTQAAHAHGIVVVARMDSSRANQGFYDAHPDWFTVDAEGKPYRAGTFGKDQEPFYTACIASPYYREFLPQVLQELCERYHPEGFSDNSWAGLSRANICHCPNCAQQFAAFSGGRALPTEKNWDDRTYRAWIEWSYALRASLWELNNATTKRFGGPDCEWSGMNSGSLAAQCATFRDWRAMTSRAKIIFLDFQGRHGTAPLWANGEAGKLIRAVMGDDAPIPESMAMYNNVSTGGAPSFRLSSKPEPEVRLWFAEAVAGGIQPWWHHIGADHEDLRQFATAEPLFAWHAANEEYLRDREHLATVGVVYSQRSVDFFGRDDASDRCEAPLRGLGHALIRARIPYAMVHADLLPDAPERYRVLILPNIGALTDAQADTLRRYVEAGGSLLATGETSLYDEWGDRRKDFALSALFGAHYAGEVLPRGGRGGRGDEAHTYLRIDSRPVPLRTGSPDDSPAFRRGWDATAHLPFGGTLVLTRPRQDTSRTVEVPLTLIPAFPIYPPEFAYMLRERSETPALYLTQPRHGSGGRVAYLPADLDRLAWQYAQTDHLDLLAALVRWLGGDAPNAVAPVQVDGRGFLDVHVYTQRPDAAGGNAASGAERVIVHLVNLTHAGTWKGPIDELNTLGPQRVRVQVPAGRRMLDARLLVAGGTAATSATSATGGREGTEGWVEALVPSIADHEVVVFELETQ